MYIICYNYHFCHKSVYILYFFSYAILLVSNTSKQSVSVINTREVMSGRLTRYITRHHIPLLTSPQLGYLSNQHLRHAMIVGRILRETLRIRYLVFGSTVYAGYYIYTLQKVNKKNT